MVSLACPRCDERFGPPRPALCLSVWGGEDNVGVGVGGVVGEEEAGASLTREAFFFFHFLVFHGLSRLPCCLFVRIFAAMMGRVVISLCFVSSQGMPYGGSIGSSFWFLPSYAPVVCSVSL